MKDRILFCELKFNGVTLDSDEFGPYTPDEVLLQGFRFAQAFDASPLKRKGVNLVYSSRKLESELPSEWLTGEGIEVPVRDGAQV